MASAILTDIPIDTISFKKPIFRIASHNAEDITVYYTSLLDNAISLYRWEFFIIGNTEYITMYTCCERGVSQWYELFGSQSPTNYASTNTLRPLVGSSCKIFTCFIVPFKCLASHYMLSPHFLLWHVLNLSHWCVM